MGSEATLIRTANKVSAYIEKHIERALAEQKEEVLDLFERLHQVFPNWVLATCPVMHPEICYLTKNGPAVFGYSNEFMLQNSKPDKYFSLVHEADQDDLAECYSFVQTSLESSLPEEHHAYRTIFYYRIRRMDGQYIYLHDEKATFSLNGVGNVYFSLFRDISAERPFNGVKVELYKQEDSLNKLAEFKPSAERSKLSRREGQLVTLIRQGFSTKEIAGQLKISHNTVRNIKSKLFEKFNVNNTVELLNMTG
jgi:DNA-binding CsgD family transcriptional regulator